MTRDEAIKILNSLFLVAEVLKVGKEKRREIKEALNMAIEALSEERMGEWIRFSFPDGDVMECTNCGYRDWADVWEEESRNYCPNCGAKMGGDDE